MSEENVEVIRRLYDAVARRDTQAVLSLYDPDVEWDGTKSRWSEVMAGPSHWRGLEGLREFSRNYYEIWEELHDELQETIEAGEHVVVIVSSRGRGRSSGAEVEFAHLPGVWTIRDGRIVRVVWYPDRDAALAAAGLSDA